MSILMRISDEHEKLLVENKAPFLFLIPTPKVENGEHVYMVNKASQNVFVGTVEGLKTVSDSHLAAYDFIDYFCEKIICDEEALREVRKVKEINLPNYNSALKLSYVYIPEGLEHIRDTNECLNLLSLSKEEARDYFRRQKKGTDLVVACDRWLQNMGMYNKYGETKTSEYIVLKNIHQEAIQVSDLMSLKDNPIKVIPKNWKYCKERALE